MYKLMVDGEVVRRDNVTRLMQFVTERLVNGFVDINGMKYGTSVPFATLLQAVERNATEVSTFGALKKNDRFLCHDNLWVKTGEFVATLVASTRVFKSDAEVNRVQVDG